MKSDKASNRLRLSFFLPNLNGGGAERVLSTLAGELAKQGMEVDFVLVNSVGINLKNLLNKVTVINLEAANTFLSLPKLFQYLRQQQPAVMISSLDLTNLIALIARRLSGVKTQLFIRIESTVSSQKRIFWKKRLEKILLSYFYPWADGIIAVSKNVADDISVYAGVSPSKIHTIYNPVINLEMFEKSYAKLEHGWIKGGGTPVILGVGRLTAPKDFPTLIKAFGLLRKKMEVKLIILGEGEERSALEGLVKSLGIDRDVDLPGYVENPYPYMRQVDVFALSSAWEGLPGALIEAMACGAPVVSTDCPSGPAEILDGGKYGHLVPVGDAQALADAIESSLNGDHRKPPASWLDQFSSEPVVQEYLKILGLV